jgi:hypothetical protein
MSQDLLAEWQFEPMQFEEPPEKDPGDDFAMADSQSDSLTTSQQATAADVWEEIDHSLVKLKLADVAEEFRERLEANERHIRFENRNNANTDAATYQILRMKEQNTEEWAKRTYETYREVWQIQGRTKSASFVRAVFTRAIVPLLHARAASIAHEFESFATRTGFPSQLCKANVQSFRLKMLRLEDRWRRWTEAEAKECEHADRKNTTGAVALGTSSIPAQALISASTRDQSASTKAPKNDIMGRTRKEAVIAKVRNPQAHTVLSTPEAALYFEVQPRTIHRWLEQGNLKSGARRGSITIASILLWQKKRSRKRPTL